jgi:hypothetical protein
VSFEESSKLGLSLPGFLGLLSDRQRGSDGEAEPAF